MLASLPAVAKPQTSFERSRRVNVLLCLSLSRCCEDTLNTGAEVVGEGLSARSARVVVWCSRHRLVVPFKERDVAKTRYAHVRVSLVQYIIFAFGY